MIAFFILFFLFAAYSYRYSWFFQALWRFHSLALKQEEKEKIKTKAYIGLFQIKSAGMFGSFK